MSAALALLAFFLLSGPLLLNGQIAANPPQGAATSAQISIPGAAITPTSGSFADGVYSNEYFHFSYRLPERWQSDQQAANPFETQSDDYGQGTAGPDLHQDVGRKYLLLNASERSANNSVQVVAYDAAGENITSGDVALAEVGALLSLGGRASGISETMIGGRTFSIGRAQINGEMRGQSQTVFAGVAAVKNGSYVLTWSFFADSPSRLQELMGTLDSIRFEQ